MAEGMHFSAQSTSCQWARQRSPFDDQALGSGRVGHNRVRINVSFRENEGEFMVAFAQVIKDQLGHSRTHGLTDWNDAQQCVAHWGLSAACCTRVIESFGIPNN